MTIENLKLSKHHTWLAAAAAAAIGVVVTVVLDPGSSWKIMYGLMGVATGLLALASTMLTPAGVGGVVGRFAVAGVVVGATFFAYMHHLANKVTSAVEGAGGSVSGVGAIASFLGTFGGICVLADMVAAASIGAAIGLQLRNKGLAGLVSRKAA